jgi:methyl-accepting chemotaxis protein
MEKGSRKGSSEITQESKSEIQELFYELFVGEMDSKLAEISSRSTELSEEVENYVRKCNNAALEINDALETIKDTVACLGEKDDWGDDNFISSLNMILREITKSKKSLDNNLDQIKSDCNDISKSIERQGNALEERYGKICDKIENIHDNTETIYDNIEAITPSFGENGILNVIVNNQNNNQKELRIQEVDITKGLEEIKEKNGSVLDIENSIKETVCEENTKLDLVNKECKKISERYFWILGVGIGISLVLNIVITIIMIV